MSKVFDKEVFNRTERIFGERGMSALADTRVIIFGVGGVGSWCAEGLVRSGIGHLTIVDSDHVCASNINRQLMATTKTVGMVKVDVLRERLLEINPEAEINSICGLYSDENYSDFNLDSYDYIIDAVDSLKHKASLLVRASRTKATLFSSMGAALKVDPTRVKVAEFWEVKGCPLGFALRKKIKRSGVLPEKKFLCVYDDEVLDNIGEMNKENSFDNNFTKAVINGTTAPVTAIFGFTLSGLVIKDIYSKIAKP